MKARYPVSWPSGQAWSASGKFNYLGAFEQTMSGGLSVKRTTIPFASGE